MPHTITYAISYRETLNSFRENLTKEKQPPRNLWDKPWRLGQFLDEVLGGGDKKSTEYVEYDLEDVE